MARPFDLVVFDLGGVLVRTVASWGEAHRRAGLPSDPPTDPAFLTLLVGLADRQDGSITSGEFFREAAAASGGAYRFDDIRRISDAWLMGEYPEIARVFDRLDAAGLDTAILSNTNDAHWPRLVSTNGNAEFPTLLRARHRFASHLLGLMKPDPAIYRVVERETGLRAPRILLFDDLEPNVAAARAVGWRAERIDPAIDPAAQMLAALGEHGI